MTGRPDGSYERYLDDVVSHAAAALSRQVGISVGLTPEHSFRGPEYRTAVLRCRVEGDAAHLPETVIVKSARGQGGASFDPSDRDPQGARARFLNECAGLRFLQTIDSDPPFAPALLATDPQHGILVIEDLGEGTNLAEALQGSDPRVAERALLAYAETLGRLHAATVGQEDSYLTIRRTLGEDDVFEGPRAGEHLASHLPVFLEVCAALDLPVSNQCREELSALERDFMRPGSWWVFSIADTCPDNHRYLPDSAGGPGAIRFFDLEFCGFQHALLEAAYLWLPFPTCWCVARLPDGLPARLEAAYRGEFVRGCPEAGDDAVFFRAMARACAVWFVITVAWAKYVVEGQDDQWGISTVRQRVPLRAANTATVLERSGDLPAVAALARDLAFRALERWGPGAEMPLYPPFNETGR